MYKYQRVTVEVPDDDLALNPIYICLTSDM